MKFKESVLVLTDGFWSLLFTFLPQVETWWQWLDRWFYITGATVAVNQLNWVYCQQKKVEEGSIE